MLDILLYIVLGFPDAFSHIYVWHKYEGHNIKKRRPIYIATLIILSSFLSITHYFLNGYIKIVFTLLAFIIACKILTNKDFKTCIILPIYSMLLLLISELIFAIIFMILFNFKNLPTFDQGFSVLIPTIIICIIYMIISKIPFIKKFYQKIVKSVSKINNKLLILVCVLLLMTINFLFATLYYKIDIKWLILINTAISAIYVIIVFKIFTIENEFIKMSNKYNTTLNSLKEYEEILDKYKIMNHENKNDLLMIRNMIVKKESGVDKYIDKLIDVKIKDDEKVMYETSIIPSGGLRAVIYSKILVMKDKKIKHKLHVDKTIRSIDLTEYSDEFVLDLCKIVSIFIDNAIEATEVSKKKELLIELFLDSKNDFNISITNTYSGNIDLTKIDVKGYTTKGNGHGYGLTLANELLAKHKDMENIRKVNKTTFTQSIVIYNN